jgi:hypothetical protein
MGSCLNRARRRPADKARRPRPRGVARFEVGAVIVEIFTVLVGIGFVAYVVWALVEVVRAMQADEEELREQREGEGGG